MDLVTREREHAFHVPSHPRDLSLNVTFSGRSMLATFNKVGGALYYSLHISCYFLYSLNQDVNLFNELICRVIPYLCPAPAPLPEVRPLSALFLLCVLCN